MTNTPEVEGQEVPIGEQHLGELMDEEIDIFEPPKRAERVYRSKAADLMEVDEDLPSVKLIQTRNYANINKITERDHLTDDNWHEWKERMRRVFYNCDINEYVTGAIKRPNEAVDSEGALHVITLLFKF